ncbi:MAG: hypothetical protein V4726_11915 [Verrucomicrobiota bacterium]
MSIAVQIDDNAYAIAKAFAEQAHCSVAVAVSRLVVESGFRPVKSETIMTNSAARFPLVKGIRVITAEQVAQLEDKS